MNFRMKLPQSLALVVLIALSFSTIARAQTWTALNNAATINAAHAMLLTDGRVMVQNYLTSDWWALIPDNTGSYVNGTWKQLASLPAGYGPLYYASGVLPDGRVVIMGGEYNLQQGVVETNMGAIYDPAQDMWVTVNPPAFSDTRIGDASGVVMANGEFLLADLTGTQLAVLDQKALTWTVLPGTGKADSNQEEGWTLLPDSTLLTIDTENGQNAERYRPKAQVWISAGTTVSPLVDAADQEIGPQVLRPDGTVFVCGATDKTGTQTGHTGIYTPPAVRTDPGTWAAGPDLPNFDSCADAPGALLISGNVLIQTSPGYTNLPSTFYEFDGTNLNPVPADLNPTPEPSYVGSMLELPSGQIFYTDTTTIVEIYTPAGTYNPAWAPTITTAPSVITRGTKTPISGTQFNGLSQGAMYGDDAQMATNYPLVQITNTASGHVFYARSLDFSTMKVATGAETVSANFIVDPVAETGPSTLVVIANGIPSAAVAVTIQ